MVYSIPAEMNHIMFSYLDAQDLSTCNRVCKSWYDQTQINALWAKFLPSCVEFDFKLNDRTIRDRFFVSQVAESFVETLDRAYVFIYNMRCGQKGTFKVVFDSLSDVSMKIDVRLTDDVNSKQISKVCTAKSRFLLPSRSLSFNSKDGRVALSIQNESGKFQNLIIKYFFVDIVNLAKEKKESNLKERTQSRNQALNDCMIFDIFLRLKTFGTSLVC